MFLRLLYTFTGILCEKLPQTIYQFKGYMYEMGNNGFAVVFFYHKKGWSQNP